MEELETLKERKSISAQVYFPSHEILVETDKCNQCDILKNENKYFQNTLKIFTKKRDNLNLFLRNQIDLNNSADLGYDYANNVKKSDKTYHDHKSPKYKTLKYNYSFFVSKAFFYIFISLRYVIMCA